MTATERTLSILTFNVHGEQDATVEQISQFINDINADIVCLQEHLSAVELKLPEHVLMSIAFAEHAELKEKQPGFLSNAIFVKRDLLKQQTKNVARSNILFPPEYKKSVPRSASVIYLEGITIANIHQTGGRGDDFLYKELRNTKSNQIDRLVRVFQPDIIVGDLNAESTEIDAREQMKTYQFYQNLSLENRDIFMEYYLGGHEALKRCNYLPIYESDSVKPTSVFGGVPDWIYVKENSNIKLVQFKKVRAIPKVSDHNAILAIFKRK